MPPSGHHRLGGSNASRWINCPGSVRMEEPFPDVTSEAASEGTAAHELLERSLTASRPPSTWLGTTIEADGLNFEVDAEMVDAVTVAYDLVQKFVAQGYELRTETRVEWSEGDEPESIGGTVDIDLWHPGKRDMVLVDYKHGRGVFVQAEGNDQLRVYAMPLILERNPNRVRVVIVQPRTGDEPVRAETLDRDDLLAWYARALNSATEAVQAEEPTLRVGPWCRFCKAKAVCPAQAAEMTALVQREFVDLDEADPLPPPTTLTAEEIGAALEKFSIIEGWMSAARDYARTLLEAGEPVPGWKLVSGRARRNWKGDDSETLAFLTETLGLPEEDMYVKKLVSPAQAEQYVKDHFEPDVRPDVNGFVVKASSTTNMVPASDPRPAVEAAVDVFTDLDEED